MDYRHKVQSKISQNGIVNVVSVVVFLTEVEKINNEWTIMMPANEQQCHQISMTTGGDFYQSEKYQYNDLSSYQHMLNQITELAARHGWQA